ncbi:MAG: Fpg/Nei family DNA glycosylase [Verrucomicrobia bacterium]|nr:Fpg/Nei family DNA glycosylase [Verrucomicrobiota bacterium]
MPELAEVEFYRRIWAEAIGSTVREVGFHPQARVFRGFDAPLDSLNLVAGATLDQAMTHGKQLLFGFGPSGWLGLHLGMSGELRTEPENHLPGRHDHLILRLSDRTLVFHDPRMFGRVRLSPGPTLPDWWTQLPPEVLSPLFTRARLEQFFLRRRGSPIKPLLLDQLAFPGIGNWMADEILWRGRIHPATPAGQLTHASRDHLWRLTQEVAGDALRVIAPDWGEAPDDWLFNHRWKNGGHCPRPKCRSPLAREELRGRTSCWCPICQVLPRS